MRRSSRVSCLQRASSASYSGCAAALKRSNASSDSQRSMVTKRRATATSRISSVVTYPGLRRNNRAQSPSVPYTRAKSSSAPALASNIQSTTNMENLSPPSPDRPWRPQRRRGSLAFWSVPDRFGFHADAVSGEELFAGAPHVRPVAHDAARRRQPIEDQGSIALRDHPAVEQQHGANVRAAANQAAEPLLQLQRSVRDEVVGEAVQARRLEPLKPCRRERIGRHLKRQFGQDQDPQRPPRDVHPFPERVRAEEDGRSRVPEAPQQLVALPLPLDEQWPAAAELAADRLGGAPQRPVAREQDEHAAVRRVRQLHQGARDGGVVPGFVVARLGEIGGHAEQALRGEVERGGVDLADLDAGGWQVEPESRLEIAELPSGG